MTDSQLTPKQQYWLEHIQAAQAFDGSLAAYAKQHELDVKALYYYQDILRQKGVIAPSCFTRVTTQLDHRSDYPSSRSASMLTITLHNGHRVELPVSIIDINQLLQSVSAL